MSILSCFSSLAPEREWWRESFRNNNGFPIYFMWGKKARICPSGFDFSQLSSSDLSGALFVRDSGRGYLWSVIPWSPNRFSPFVWNTFQSWFYPLPLCEGLSLCFDLAKCVPSGIQLLGTMNSCGTFTCENRDLRCFFYELDLCCRQRPRMFPHQAVLNDRFSPDHMVMGLWSGSTVPFCDIDSFHILDYAGWMRSYHYGWHPYRWGLLCSAQLRVDLPGMVPAS